MATIRGAVPVEISTTVTERLMKLKPGPAGPMPILIGGGGEKVTLRLVAEHAQMWNSTASPDEYALSFFAQMRFARC